jgi:chromosome segregation protein
VYVSRIEMVGFKSFVEKTVVDLEPGLTSIVGPNGCGKTNICDAIRWVLGEENVRLLRGTRAEDVIFAGTELRKSTGYAEVALTLADVKDVLPVDYADVTVTRRAYRSGESEFLINNVPSRLKDIVDLFLGTGMGRRAYSVMERDMIDWILDDTSGQRRKIIEEAAGISKYKVRRKETQSKLELTQRDLERVGDLISEVERRVRQLARQAARARRYERLTGRIRQVETYGSAKELAAMKARRDEVGRELGSIDARMVEHTSRIARLEADIEKTRLAVVEIERETNEQGARIAETTQAAQKLENDRGVLTERTRSIDEKLGEIAAERAERERQLKEKSDILTAKTAEAAEAAEKLTALSKTFAELQAEYQRLDSDLKARREESVASVRKRLEDMKRTMDVTSSFTELRTRKMHLGESLEKLQQKREWMAGRARELEGEVERLRADCERAGADFMARSARLDDVARVIDEVTAKVDKIREELGSLAEEEARSSSRHDVLKELVERYEGYEAGVRVLVEGERRHEGVHGVVGDVVRCTEPRYEPALAAALYSSLQYVIVEGKDRAIDSVRMLKQEKKGQATLLMLDSIPEPAGRGEPDVGGEGVIGRVVDYVTCEPRYRLVVEYLLKDVYIVESLDTAFSLSRRGVNGTHNFVTPDGDAVLRGSIVRAGGNGDTSGALIGRRQKLSELSSHVEAVRNLAREQDKAFAELKTSLEELKREREVLEKDHEEARRLVAEVEKAHGGKTSEYDALAKSGLELDGEIGGLEKWIETIDGELATLTRDQALVKADQADLFDKVESHDGLEKEVTGLQKQLEEANFEVLRLEATRDFVHDTIARLKVEADSTARSLEDLDRREQDLAGRKQQIVESQANLAGEIQKLVAIIAGMERVRGEALERKRGLEITVENARTQVKAAQHQREEILTSKQDLQSEINLIGVKADALKRRMAEEFDVDIEAVDLGALEPLESCEEELTKLRGFLRDLGPVNLVALEEYDVERERYMFLKTQRDDLIKARESLDEAIVQINKRARTDFVEIFAKVRQDFRRNFQTLFAGGDADLRIQDENDPLESPVEIFAQPSGKKLDHISLLSGGERALTALAFLFAVYYTKPSPFCLLDEVDAPLDDANVLRFVNLLRDFSAKTQFLIVTHNKKTMESASCLYGVTMEEPGVSRVVSVRLERTRDGVPETSAV